MKKTYRGFTIDVIVKGEGSGHLEGKRLDRTGTRNSKSLARNGGVEGYKTGGEAKEAGLRWGEEQINAYAENRRPTL